MYPRRDQRWMPYFTESSPSKSVLQRFINLHRANFLSQLGPAAQNFRIFQRGAARCVGFPVAQQNVFVARFSVAIENIAAVPPRREGSNEGSHREQRPLFVPRQSLKDRNR